jgi:hypothetical protein
MHPVSLGLLAGRKDASLRGLAVESPQRSTYWPVARSRKTNLFTARLRRDDSARRALLQACKRYPSGCVPWRLIWPPQRRQVQSSSQPQRGSTILHCGECLLDRKNRQARVKASVANRPPTAASLRQLGARRSIPSLYSSRSPLAVVRGRRGRPRPADYGFRSSSSALKVAYIPAVVRFMRTR